MWWENHRTGMHMTRSLHISGFKSRRGFGSYVACLWYVDLAVSMFFSFCVCRIILVMNTWPLSTRENNPPWMLPRTHQWCIIIALAAYTIIEPWQIYWTRCPLILWDGASILSYVFFVILLQVRMATLPKTLGGLTRSITDGSIIW